MTRTTVDLGIDLGTTNSAVTSTDWPDCFVMPSVVHLAADQLVTTGAAALHALGTDGANAQAEFKRLMGTDTKLQFKAADVWRTPEELSAEVLKALRQWVREEKKEDLDCAVITVPALFEIPQNEATERAAALAGITFAPLLQEPIAAALAYCFGQPNQEKSFWLVYDFGGGTFDASLVSLRHGRLAVIDHDGDNFLGGKDLDRRVLEIFLSRLREGQDLPALAPEHPGHRKVMTGLRRLAEQSRIALSSQPTVSVALSDLHLGEREKPLSGELTLTRVELDRVILPEVSRSVAICERLLERHRLSSDDVAKLVLVGGVTQTPLIRQILNERLGITLECDLDPATTVARGAALHASTLRRPRPATRSNQDALPLRLEYPSTSQDLRPYVVGRFLARDKSGDETPTWVEVARSPGQWTTGRIPVNDQGAFLCQIELIEGASTTFTLRAGGQDEQQVAIDPSSFAIAHGLALSAPPLSRSLGVGLADNSVHVYLSKGTSLPARASHLHRTTTALEPGQPGAVIDVPVVQGESERADRNRHVGTLCIPATRIRRALPANSEVEVTVEVDGSSTVRARAYVPFLDQIFEQVLSTRLVPATADELEGELELAFRRRSKLDESTEGSVLVAEIGDDPFDDIIRDIAAASLGDHDAALRAQRRLLELHEKLDQAEADVRWPRQISRAHRAKVSTHGAVDEYGSQADRELHRGLENDVAQAVTARDLRALERKTGALWRLRHRILSRRPEYWIDLFWWLERRQETTTDPKRARRLVEEGRKALDHRDYATLERVVLDLDSLLAPEDEDRPLGLQSHVR